MRTLILIPGLLLFSLFVAQAQTVSSKIMDANVSWTPSGSQYAGQLNVYLTDTIGIAGLHIDLGTAADSSDLYTVQYTISGSGTFFSVGNIDANNVLHVPIGTYAYHEDYYAKLSVSLDNNQSNDIAIHSSN